MTYEHGDPLIMGILNVTPDSFSDGGRFVSLEPALRQVREMIGHGADIIDIGGESTRPGALPVPAEEQIVRVLPVIEAIRKEIGTGFKISVDTTLSPVAKAALDAGADIINDVSAGRHDPAIFDLAAKREVPIVLMHMQGSPETMQDRPYYDSVVDEVLDFLVARADAAMQAGVKPENIMIDPGIGFGKRKQDNIDLMARLDRFVATGYPVLLGASRKRFMGAILDVTQPSELVTATAVTTALGVMAGVGIFRVHDVLENRQAADVAAAIRQAARRM
ncbi:MAG: dihydropteroate synthase [Gammaproteobacteria bacterium]